MKSAIFAVTRQGGQTAKRIQAVFPEAPVFLYGQWTAESDSMSLQERVEEQFFQAECLVFVMATGITVRMIAKHLKGKDTDPAVLVVDDGGKYVIPLLSGHLGGANQWATRLADALGATAVVTTATDNRQLLAVDMLAVKLGAVIHDLQSVKMATAKLLETGGLSLWSWQRQMKSLPEEYEVIESIAHADIIISPYKKDYNPEKPWLIPKIIVAGMGCRKGITAEALYEVLAEGLEQIGADLRSVQKIASVDLKAEEPGLIALGRRLAVPFQTYTPVELNGVSMGFKQSQFVRQTTGTGSVSEAAGYLASSGGTCLLERQAKSGITLSLWEATDEAW